MSVATFFGLLGRPDPADVVRRYGPQVHRHLQRIFGPRADVDDVYQMVFVEVLRSLPSFEGRARLSTWIRRITWNVAYQEMRLQYRHKRVGELDEAQVDGGVPSVEATLDDKRALERLYEALAALDPQKRAAVVLHDIEGRTLKDIGAQLGRPLPTVASQLYAGRAQLARLMRKRGLLEPTTQSIEPGDSAEEEVS